MAKKGPKINVTSKDKSWRLVYDDSEEADLFESEGVTATTKTIEEFLSEEEGIARIKELGKVRL